jgi:hypothetical protein
VQLDDVTSEEEQINLPGTTDERPNWRRRLSRSLEELRNDSRLKAMARDLAEQRKVVPEYQAKARSSVEKDAVKDLQLLPVRTKHST